MTTKQFFKFLIITAVLSCGSLGAAEDEYPQDSNTIRQDGIINTVSLSTMSLIIDDSAFRIVPYAKIHANEQYPDIHTVRDLKSDIYVDVKLENVDDQPIITELWLLDLPPDLGG